MIEWVRKDSKREVWWPSQRLKRRAWMSNEDIYRQAAKDPVKFWATLAKEGITWFKPWRKVYVEKKPFAFQWFVGGKLNACYNCLDRHEKSWKRNKVALVWEPEPIEERNRVLTYYELYRRVNRFANALSNLGVRKGDIVSIYLPMIPEVIIAMLACARIGAIHSVVFSAFSPQALRSRIEDAEAKVLITCDGYYRRGKLIELKQQADEAVRGTSVERVIVVRRAGNEIVWNDERDEWWDEVEKGAKSYCEPAAMDSEDILFILYTSGTTGKPKGVYHSIGGYTVQAYWTTRWDFDLHDDDLMWCTADIGWITSHTYSCYGPLLNGASFLIYEGAPDYPQPDRWWEIVEKYGVTIFYTAPTAIRMFMRYGDEWVKKHDLNSLRILGTVGEPIDKEAWLWYFKVIGQQRCPIIDTWWQTETGGTLINALPGIGPFIPSFAGKSFPGTRHAVVDESGRPVKPGQHGSLVQLPPFAPGMLRGLWKDPERYEETYWKKFGAKVYYTGDRAYVDEEGNFRILGREDDVMKVAGHRLANAELEDALNKHPAVVESAVIGAPHAIKGEIPWAFVVLKEGHKPSAKLEAELIGQVSKLIGPIAKPERIFFVEDLPKTRSGKIMRRVIKRLIKNEELGDLSTLMNPESVEELKRVVK